MQTTDCIQLVCGDRHLQRCSSGPTMRLLTVLRVEDAKSHCLHAVAGMSAASSSFATGPDRTPPPMISRSQLATIVSGVPAAADVFPSPSAAQSRARGNSASPAAAAVRSTPDPATAKPQVRFLTTFSIITCGIAHC